LAHLFAIKFELKEAVTIILEAKAGKPESLTLPSPKGSQEEGRGSQEEGGVAGTWLTSNRILIVIYWR